MKIRFSILLMLLVCSFQETFAQQHNLTPLSDCRFVKKASGPRDNLSGSTCTPCGEARKKEKIAKAAEQKKRNEIAAAKIKAANKARQEAFLAEQKKKSEEAEKQRKASEVSIAMPAEKPSATQTTVKHAGEITDNTVMVARGAQAGFKPTFENEKGEILLENDEWSNTHSIQEISYTDNSIKNYGVVKFGDFNSYWKPGTFHYDIITPKGIPLLNDLEVYDIKYLTDGWFLVGNRTQDYVFNIKTKKKVLLDDLGDEGTLDRDFLPIFPENVKLSSNSVSFLKKHLIQRFPDKVNEGMLSAFSFGLLTTDLPANYLAPFYYYEFERNLGSHKRIDLLLFDKEGKLTRVSLK